MPGFIVYYPYWQLYSHSIVNKLRKLSAGAGFTVISIVNTMKSTMFNIFC